MLSFSGTHSSNLRRHVLPMSSSRPLDSSVRSIRFKDTGTLTSGSMKRSCRPVATSLALNKTRLRSCRSSKTLYKRHWKRLVIALLSISLSSTKLSLRALSTQMLPQLWTNTTMTPTQGWSTSRTIKFLATSLSRTWPAKTSTPLVWCRGMRWCSSLRESQRRNLSSSSRV